MTRTAILSLVLAGAFAAALTGSASALPGDNGRIAFVSNDGSTNRIYTINPDGTGEQHIANGDDPSVSPDGSKIAFTAVDVPVGGGFDLDIVVVDADGSGGFTNLTQESPLFAPMDEQPAWSPDGSRIAWVRKAPLGLQQIWVMDADGSNRAQLTFTTGPLGSSKGNVEPTWSPDGSKIYFTSTRDDDPEIYVMDADGSDQTRLTDTDGLDSGPNVSPDGSTVAFTSTRDTPGAPGFQIYTMDADGSDETRLSDGTFLELDPSYSPDGSKIAVTSYRAGGTQTEIWTMDADGTNPERVTDMDALNSLPDWGTDGGGCTMLGTASADRLKGTPGDDVICGFGGPDRINGRGGDDVLFGGDGNDQLIGGAGVDELNGGAGGLDTANFNAGATQGVEVDLETNSVANDGGGFAERITGVERIEGARNQVNILFGDDANNVLIGGLLGDEFFGGEGDDLLRGEPERAASGGDDFLNGFLGDDVFFPGLGTNRIEGDQGNDTLRYTGLAGTDGVTILSSGPAGTTTGAVNDTFTFIENFVGTPNDDAFETLWNPVATTISGRPGDDILVSGDGDALDRTHGGDGADICRDGGDGDTQISCVSG